LIGVSTTSRGMGVGAGRETRDGPRGPFAKAAPKCHWQSIQVKLISLDRPFALTNCTLAAWGSVNPMSQHGRSRPFGERLTSASTPPAGGSTTLARSLAFVVWEVREQPLDVDRNILNARHRLARVVASAAQFVRSGQSIVFLEHAMADIQDPHQRDTTT
jgi:hypothetical protein